MHFTTPSLPLGPTLYTSLPAQQRRPANKDHTKPAISGGHRGEMCPDNFNLFLSLLPLNASFLPRTSNMEV